MANSKFGESCRVCSLVLFSLFLFLPALARAEEPVHTLKGLQTVLRPGNSVLVDTVDGNSVLGKVESISDSSLRLRIYGMSREFLEPQIREVTKVSKARVRGAWIGAAIGGIAGALIGAGISDAFCDGCGNQQGQGAAVGGVIGGMYGAGIGFIGARKQSLKTVFEATQATPKRIRVSPKLSRETKGVVLAFRF